MDKVKINKAIDALSLSVDNKNTLKEALNHEGGDDITTIENKVNTINKELNTAKSDISNLGVKVNNFINANEIIKLAIGDDEETKAANIAKLGNTQHTFFASINNAYGTASWLPTDGGNAFIVSDEGHAVTYKISTDGAVTKLSEFTLAKPTEYTLPAATKTTLGGVKAITNIVNVDTETATVGSLAGVVNTLLNQLRAAGIIQL
nr:MAG TPA: Head fiber protein [Crassvirales sp.]